MEQDLQQEDEEEAADDPDISRRMRLSPSSTANTSITIPEAIAQEDFNLSIDLPTMDEDEFGSVSDFNIPETVAASEKVKTDKSSFSVASMKKLTKFLGNFNLSQDAYQRMIKTSEEFIKYEIDQLAHAASNEGYSTINVFNVLDFVNDTHLGPNDLFNDASQDEIFDLAIKLFDLESINDLNGVMWPNRRRKPKQPLGSALTDEFTQTPANSPSRAPRTPKKPEVDAEETAMPTEPSSDEEENSLDDFIDDTNVQTPIDTQALSFSRLNTFLASPSEDEHSFDDYDVPVAEEEEEEE